MTDENNTEKKPFWENIATGKKGRGRKRNEPTARPRSDSRQRGTEGEKAPHREGPAPHIERTVRKPRAEERKTHRFPFTPPVVSGHVFTQPAGDARALLDAFFDIAQAALPLDSKKIQQLPGIIRELSHNLTDERSDRRLGYMNDPASISAYVRFYQWWNLVRLTRLFSSLPLTLESGSVLADIGSGPLTVPIALWIARPDLRDKELTWYCLDLSQNALAAGEELYLQYVAKTGGSPWKIVRVRGEFGTTLKRRVSTVICANMFNELIEGQERPLEALAKDYARELSSYADEESSVLVIEPGVPFAARFISLLRDSLSRLGFAPVAPCPHDGPCPFPGQRGCKWCHFVFDTKDAPKRLHSLSEDAGLSKDRAALSFIHAVRSAPKEEQQSVVEELSSRAVVSRLKKSFGAMPARIMSDPIRLPEFQTGRYACSEIGMLLVCGSYRAADFLRDCASGSLVDLPRPDMRHLERDGKTGAIIIRLKDRADRS